MTMRKGDCGCNGVYGFFEKRRREDILLISAIWAAKFWGLTLALGYPVWRFFWALGWVVGCQKWVIQLEFFSMYDDQRGFWVEICGSIVRLCAIVGSGCHLQGVRQVPCR